MLQMCPRRADEKKSGGEPPQSRQSTANSQQFREKHKGRPRAAPFRFSQPSANHRRRFETHARQEAHLELYSCGCKAAWPRAEVLRIFLPRRNVQVFRLAILSEME